MRMMKTNTRFFFLFCREDCERQQSAITGLDMCILQGKIACFEIVRIKGFNFCKKENCIYKILYKLLFLFPQCHIRTHYLLTNYILKYKFSNIKDETIENVIEVSWCLCTVV
jgi:hypothetical protein